MRMSFEMVPKQQVQVALAGVAAHMLDLTDPFQEAFRAQEEAQRAPFAGGELVKTGTLRDSLTQPNAEGSIREAHAAEAEFGTSVRYAKPAAARAGTHVLVDPVEELDALFMEYIVEPYEL